MARWQSRWSPAAAGALAWHPQPIWAIVVGLTLVSLAIGYPLGDALADRWPDEAVGVHWHDCAVSPGRSFSDQHDDLLLINTTIFGIPLAVRWYGVLIVGGAMLAGWLAARRAERCGYEPEHIWNLLLLGMVFGIVGARLYYVAFEWEQFRGDILKIINTTTGGLAIHGALIGAITAALIYTRRHRLPFLTFLDICILRFCSRRRWVAGATL